MRRLLRDACCLLCDVSDNAGLQKSLDIADYLVGIIDSREAQIEAIMAKKRERVRENKQKRAEVKRKADKKKADEEALKSRKKLHVWHLQQQNRLWDHQDQWEPGKKRYVCSAH